MWIPILLFLISVAGSMGDADEDIHCPKDDERECDAMYEEWPKGFPETAEQLQNFCVYITRLGKCILNLRENCPGQDPVKVERFRKIVNYVEQYCQEDSAEYQEVLENLPCLKRAADKSLEKCVSGLTEDDLVAFRSRVQEIVDNSDNLNDEDDFDCVHRTAANACEYFIVGEECGASLRRTVTEIRENVDDAAEYCRDEALQELDSLKDMLHTLILQEEKE